eukprot:2090272-Rhodomonas_salina.1
MCGFDAATVGTDNAYAARCAVQRLRCAVLTASATRCAVLRCHGRTPGNQTQQTTISVQSAPGMRFLVFDFGVYAKCGTEMSRSCAVRCWDPRHAWQLEKVILNQMQKKTFLVFNTNGTGSR